MKTVALLILATMLAVPGAAADEDPCETGLDGAASVVCRGPTDEGIGCVARADGWTGAGCGLVGFNCFSVIWGIHNNVISVGGYSSCQAGVFVNVPPTG